MKKNSTSDYISKEEVNEMIENALRRHNRRSTIISSILGWVLIGGYSFGLFHVVIRHVGMFHFVCSLFVLSSFQSLTKQIQNRFAKG